MKRIKIVNRDNSPICHDENWRSQDSESVSIQAQIVLTGTYVTSLLRVVYVHFIYNIKCSIIGYGSR